MVHWFGVLVLFVIASSEARAEPCVNFYDTPTHESHRAMRDALGKHYTLFEASEERVSYFNLEVTVIIREWLEKQFYFLEGERSTLETILRSDWGLDPVITAVETIIARKVLDLAIEEPFQMMGKRGKEMERARESGSSRPDLEGIFEVYPIATRRQANEIADLRNDLLFELTRSDRPYQVVPRTHDLWTQPQVRMNAGTNEEMWVRLDENTRLRVRLVGGYMIEITKIERD